jgi:hypothetical protein
VPADETDHLDLEPRECDASRCGCGGSPGADSGPVMGGTRKRRLPCGVRTLPPSARLAPAPATGGRLGDDMSTSTPAADRRKPISFVQGGLWTISSPQRGKAMVALRGRTPGRIDELRLVDRDRSRKRKGQWASNVVLVKLSGPTQDQTCIYKLAKIWWASHEEFVSFGVGHWFSVEERNDGGYNVALRLSGSAARDKNVQEIPSGGVVLRQDDPHLWESVASSMTQAALASLSGVPTTIADLQQSCFAAYFAKSRSI